ncbi:MAG TPA: ComEC/Rec2 family competence protein [Rhabdaerophilum sp.]|nr:ComEC/Rec2 family competence protein [Rhabdaerophilum sp.]
MREAGKRSVGLALAAAGGPARREAADDSLLTAFHALLSREAGHRTGFLWLPVALGIGILAYFGAREEPALWAGAISALAALPLALLTRGAPRMVSIAILFVMLGFTGATVRTALMASPMLDREVFGMVSGHVETVDLLQSRQRVTLRVTKIEGIAEAAQPYRVRLGIPGRSGVEPGAFVTIRARLMPPSEPALPGGYDFRREAFFRATGGVGYAIGAVAKGTPPELAPLDLRALAAIDRWRNTLTLRIATAIGGEAGALAAALITGKRGLIPETTNDELRASGLYHIVSISGLHMVLAAGVLFWSLRALLAAFPSVALRYPVKKYAAAGAMLGAIAYCIFSGSEVATVRSLVMTLVMLGAILFDRPALAMRNLAISAILVLLAEPEALLGPSFQMSFAAVGCLIGANRAWQDWKAGRPRSEHGAMQRAGMKLLMAFVAIGATTLVATLATAPFSAHHFHRLNPLGLIGNALGIPLVSLVVMPCAVAGTLLVPFGLDGIVWAIMGEGVRGVLVVASWVASFENASVTTAHVHGAGFALLVLALLIFIGFRTILRAAALVPLLAALPFLRAPALPDIVVNQDGRTALVRAQDGRYRLLAVGSPNRFTLSQWLPALGDGREPSAASLRQDTRCDNKGCVGRLADGRSVALVADRASLREDCQRADIIISNLPTIATCSHEGQHVLDKAHFERYGATLIRSRSSVEWKTQTTLDPAIDRPWRKKAVAIEKPLLVKPSSVRRPSGPETLDDDPALLPQQKAGDQ